MNERERATPSDVGAPMSAPFADDAQFRALVTHASDIFTVVDADGTVRYQSPAAAVVLGYDSDNAVGQHIFRHVHADDAHVADQYFERVLTHPGPQAPLDLRFECGDGEWRLLETRGVNLLLLPEVRGILFNSRDVTEQRAQAELLRRQDQQLRALVERAPDVISRIDRATALHLR